MGANVERVPYPCGGCGVEVTHEVVDALPVEAAFDLVVAGLCPGCLIQRGGDANEEGPIAGSASDASGSVGEGPGCVGNGRLAP